MVGNAVPVGVGPWAAPVFGRTRYGRAHIIFIFHPITICIQEGTATVFYFTGHIRAEILMVRDSIPIPVGAAIQAGRARIVGTFVQVIRDSIPVPVGATLGSLGPGFIGTQVVFIRDSIPIPVGTSSEFLQTRNIGTFIFMIRDSIPIPVGTSPEFPRTGNGRTVVKLIRNTIVIKIFWGFAMPDGNFHTQVNT